MLPTRSITLDFECLPVPLAGRTARLFGRATIGYDGRGNWAPTALTVYGNTPRAEDNHFSPGTEVFLTVAKALAVHRREEIADAINADLDAAGGHMALFGEALPCPAARFGLPPFSQLGHRPRA